MNALEFFKSQYPVFLISRITGFAPFSFHVDAAKPNHQWVLLSFPWLVYSILLYCAYLAAFAVCYDVSWRVPMERGYPFISVIGAVLGSGQWERKK